MGKKKDQDEMPDSGDTVDPQPDPGASSPGLKKHRLNVPPGTGSVSVAGPDGEPVEIFAVDGVIEVDGSFDVSELITKHGCTQA